MANEAERYFGSRYCIFGKCSVCIFYVLCRSYGHFCVKIISLTTFICHAVCQSPWKPSVVTAVCLTEAHFQLVLEVLSKKSSVCLFFSWSCDYCCSVWVQQCNTSFFSVLQLARYATEGLLQLGPLGSTTFLPDTKCLVDDGRGRTPRLKKCDAVSRSSQRLWDFTQVIFWLWSSAGQHFRHTKCNED